MGFSLELALRYLGSKKRAFVSVGTVFAIIGVALGVAALTTVMSVTGGFRAEFREKVLGVNAHVLVLKYSSDFREYREIMDQMKSVPGVEGIAPFVISPMMVTHGDKTATGVLLKGVDPELMPSVLDLPRHMAEVLTPEGVVRHNSITNPLPPAAIQDALLRLRLPGSKPPERRRGSMLDELGKAPKKPKTAKRAESSEPADAGNVPLLRAIEESLANPTANDPLDAGAPPRTEKEAPRPPASSDPSEAAAEEALDPGAPVGNIEPEGGYRSQLPEDDELPEEVDPDPCKDKAAVEKMPGIIIGATLRKNLDVDLGECVQVTSPTIGFTYSRGAIRAPVAKQFKVIAVFDAGFDQYDSKLVYTDLFEAQAFYDSGDSVTGVEMKVKDIDEARAIARHIDDTLSNGIYHTMDWEELNHGLFTALRIQQLVMSSVLALIIVVAAFTVIATLIMVVLDKKKEIAVLKAMGATDVTLLRSFLYQGGIIGVFGTVIGLGIGLAVCKGLLIYGFPLDPKVYFISRLPVQVRWGEFVLVGQFAIWVCLIASAWPALYAARLRPAEAFREQQ
jgi:lipoprotein-releasing system permease protein